MRPQFASKFVLVWVVILAGDYTRLPPPANASHFTNTANPVAGRRVEIFLWLPKCPDNDLLSASLQRLLC